MNMPRRNRKRERERIQVYQQSSRHVSFDVYEREKEREVGYTERH